MTERNNIRIVHLMDAPGAAAVLACWFVDEWTPWYGPDGLGDAVADLAACCGRDTIPICLVALDGSGKALGTAALRTSSAGDELGVGPWLAALLVAKEQRGRGVGARLIEAIEQEARRLGYAAVYTSTDTAEGLLHRRGWRAIGGTETLKGAATVYCRDLGDA